VTHPAAPLSNAACRARQARAQDAMAAAGIGGLLLTTPAEFAYFTGYLTRFWESPSRPWYLLLPVEGPVVAVIPAIGAVLMAQCAVDEIRTWPSPDGADEGRTLLTEAIAEGVAGQGPIALPDGPEDVPRVGFSALADLQRRLSGLPRAVHLVGDGGLVAQLRARKTAEEIAAIAHVCDIAGRAFARVPEVARAGIPVDQVFRSFQALLLEEGADWVSYLAGGAGPDGYGDVISPARAVPLAAGYILMLDTGAVRNGYFCDFDRNFSVGPASAKAESAHARLLEATAAAFDAARPGVTMADLWAAMSPALGDAAVSGRRGHGLGLQLTEGASLLAHDDTVLEAGMVLTLEPAIETGAARMLVHEENIAITEAGARWLSPRVQGSMPVLEG